jgi:CHAT domain-containing protein/tetratricopeptide (TPR) repeat protein
MSGIEAGRSPRGRFRRGFSRICAKTVSTSMPAAMPSEAAPHLLAFAPLAFALLAFALLGGCDRPPPDAYVSTDKAGPSAAQQVAIGKNGVGEECTQAVGADRSADIYCGTWTQPSAQVRYGGPVGSGGLAQFVSASPWRVSIDARFRCAAPQATQILGGRSAYLLQCTRMIGGFPHVALVADVDGTIWYADGALAAAPVIERSIGVMSGVAGAAGSPSAGGAEANALWAQRLAAQAVSSGDIGKFNDLITAGTNANLANDPDAAEKAFRAALSLQQKALKNPDDPNTATTRLLLAGQLSNQRRYAEAQTLFEQAARLAPRAADPLTFARLDHYRGLDALNQGKFNEALALLTAAEAAYAANVPSDLLQAKARPTVARSFTFARVPVGATDAAALAAARSASGTQQTQLALLGVIEARRNRAVVLRLLGRPQEADALLASANDLARGNDLLTPALVARLYRTTALTSVSQNQADQAIDQLQSATQEFNRSALRDSKPLAETFLLQAGERSRLGHGDRALPLCREAVSLLMTLRVGTTADLMAPCLTAYARAAKAGGADAQALLAEMFTAAQIVQGTVTSRQIALASAALAENARDPRVGEAIRQQHDLQDKLSALLSRRDELVHGGGQPAGSQGAAQGQVDELERQIADVRARSQEAERVLVDASPNYGQLVQQVVSAKDVFAALRPDEALVTIALPEGGGSGWTFVLRGNQITVAETGGSTGDIAASVARIRKSVEVDPGATPGPFPTADALKLYTMTLGRVAPALEGAESLIVAPSGPLLSVPFAVLLTGPADSDNLAAAPWLVRRFAIAHVPAAGNFVGLRRAAGGSRATRKWFGFGDFKPVTLAQAQRSFPPSVCRDSAAMLAGLEPLPAATKSLEVARRLFNASAQDELLGAAFTAQRVLNTRLSDYRILHFATHGVLPNELPCEGEPAIITSNTPGAADARGALLTSSMIRNLQLDADLVILSACNSGGAGGGESLSSFARTFFYAGSRALLVTHWSIGEAPSAYLIAEFLSRLQQDPTAGVAKVLRATQIGLLDDAGKGLPADFAHPFFWASFVVFGEGGGGIGPAPRT